MSSAYAQSKHPSRNCSHPVSDFSRNRSYPASDYSPAFNKQTLFISPTKKITIQLKAKSLIALMDSVYGWQWDTVPNGWAINPSWKDINIVYDANNNLTSLLGQNWNGTGTTWVNSWQHTYTYDANNNQTSELYQTWNGSAWVNSRQSTYTYDANNFIQSEAYKYWNNTGTNITSGDSMYYYFHIVAGINELMANGESIDIYPNPASTSFEITTNNKQIIQEVKLYSIEGKLLKQQTFLENKAKINTSQLPQGMYIIEVKTKKEQVYKKLLILH